MFAGASAMLTLIFQSTVDAQNFVQVADLMKVMVVAVPSEPPGYVPQKQ
jgi:hypothetical protein